MLGSCGAGRPIVNEAILNRQRLYVHVTLKTQAFMSEITLTLPDGSQQRALAGTTPLEVARSLSRRLADEAIAARVNGELVDLTRPLEHDGTLEILTPKNREAL